MKTIIDQSYEVVRRLDLSGDSLHKLVFLVREIETNTLQVLKLYLPNENEEFIQELRNLIYLNETLPEFNMNKILNYHKY